MWIRLSTFVERVRASLFFLPMVAVLTGVGAGLVSIAVDSQVDGLTDLPFVLTSTVDSARAVLTTVAGATMAFAGIAFSISLLVIQLASGQYSPRVVHTLFRDPFNKRVMALVVGTFTFCLIVLRPVRSSVEEGGDAVIPNLSVALAVVLGVATILAVIAFINHNAHSMDISEILERVREETMTQVRSAWSKAPDPEPVAPEPTGPLHEVRFDHTGWVQRIDVDGLLECAPEGGTIFLQTHPGRYAIAGTLLGRLSPAPAPDDTERAEHAIAAAVGLGHTRSMHQDPSYGLRQLVDIALRALSPGVNDPTTAQDAVFHASAVLVELLHRHPMPSVHMTTDGRRLVLLEQPGHDDLVRLAFDEVRRAAAEHPTVCLYLLEAIHLLVESLQAAGTDAGLDALHDQARLVLAGVEAAGVEAAGVLPDDLGRVRAAYEMRFGATA